MRYLVPILLLGLLACREPEEETINLQDIIEYGTGEEKEMEHGSDIDSSRRVVNVFVRNGIEADYAVGIANKLFPDRFGPDSTIKYELGREEQKFYYHRWIYADSVKVVNAFFNWIDCFGKNCSSYYVGEEGNFQKEAFVLLAGQKDMIYVEGSDQSADKWIAFHDSLGIEPDWSFIIEQKERGKARWFTMKDEEKIKFEK